MSARRTRRELVGLGTRHREGRLERLLELEQLAYATYGQALRSGRLDRRAELLMHELREQELDHAEALAARLDRAVEPSMPSPAELERSLARAGVSVRLTTRRTGSEWIDLLERVEGVLEDAYYHAIRHFEAAEIALLAATIMANEAQHAALLGRLRHPSSVFASVPASDVPADAAAN